MDVIYGFCVDVRSYEFLKKHVGVLFTNEYFYPNRKLKPHRLEEFDIKIAEISANIQNLIIPCENIIMHVRDQHLIIGVSLSIHHIGDEGILEMRGTELNDYAIIDNFIMYNTYFEPIQESIYAVNLNGFGLNNSFSGELHDSVIDISLLR